MINRISRISVALVALFLFAGSFSLASAHTGGQPNVPPGLEVPAGNALLFGRHAEGVQIYVCQAGQWAFRAPHAKLFDPETGRPNGHHYGGIDRGLTPGPWWEDARDESRVRGGNPVPAPSNNPNSIPQLRLQALEHNGSGVFANVTYIQRLNTIGGVGPTGACKEEGARRRVPYTADYYFYGAN